MSDTSANSIKLAPSPAAVWLVRLLALAALGASIYLFIISSGVVAGCGQAGCDAVLASRWATWFGLPTSAAAMGSHLIVLAATAFLGPRATGKQQRIAWTILLTFSVAIVGAALWFVSVQAFELKQFCPFCMVVHVCGVILAVFLWTIGLRRITAGLAFAAVAIGVLGVAGLVIGQMTLAPTSHQELTASTASDPVTKPAGTDRPSPKPAAKPTNPNKVYLYGRRISINRNQVPILGSPDAPHLMLSLFDYTCSHCTKLHRYLKQVLKRYDGQLAIAALPVPLDGKCNANIPIPATRPQHQDACTLAMIGLRVWLVNPKAFATFDDWMFAGSEPPPVQAAKAYAAKLVGAQPFEQTRLDPRIIRQIKNNVKIPTLLPRQTLPILIMRTKVTFGLIAAPQQLYKLIEKDYQITPVAPQAESGTR